MNELEKAKQGDYYNPNYDEELILKRRKTADLCFKYNNTLPSNIEERNDIIKRLINTCDSNFLLEQPIHIDYGDNVKIGKNFYSNYNLTILDGVDVVFGDNCFIGPNCSFYTAIHPFDYNLRNKGLEKAKPISIGDNCWFGGGVIVLPGVSIGSNCVIGAGSVVTHNIPDNVIVAGNPAKIIKTIEEGIENEK